MISGHHRWRFVLQVISSTGPTDQTYLTYIPCILYENLSFEATLPTLLLFYLLKEFDVLCVGKAILAIIGRLSRKLEIGGDLKSDLKHRFH